MERETEKVPGGKHSTTTVRRAQRLTRCENRNEEQAICQSKHRNCEPEMQMKEKNLQKSEKLATKYEWFLGLQRWLGEANAHPKPRCQKQQRGLENTES